MEAEKKIYPSGVLASSKISKKRQTTENDDKKMGTQEEKPKGVLPTWVSTGGVMERICRVRETRWD